MNFLDIGLLAIIVLFTMRGLFKGFLSEIFALGALVAGVFAASRYYDVVEPHLQVYMSNPTGVKAASYLLTFLAAMILVSLVGKLVKTMLVVPVLGGADRIAGGAFGALEGVLIGLILLLMIQSFMPKADFLKESVLTPKAQPALVYLADFTPESMRETLKEGGIVLPESSEEQPAE